MRMGYEISLITVALLGLGVGLIVVLARIGRHLVRLQQEITALVRVVKDMYDLMDEPRQLANAQARAAFLGKKPGDVDWPTRSGYPG